MMVYWSVSVFDILDLLDTLLSLKVPLQIRYRGELVLVGVKKEIESSVSKIMKNYVKVWEGEDV